jgi:hypothetical protein
MYGIGFLDMESGCLIVSKAHQRVAQALWINRHCTGLCVDKTSGGKWGLKGYNILDFSAI